jgi:hypothetical protein
MLEAISIVMSLFMMSSDNGGDFVTSSNLVQVQIQFLRGEEIFLDFKWSYLH